MIALLLKKKVLIALISIASTLLVFCCLGGALLVVFFGAAGSQQGLTAGLCGPLAAEASASVAPVLAAPSASGRPLPARVGRWNGEQLKIAAVLVAVGRDMNIPPRGWVIAVATAMQESTLRNLDHGDRDSVGIMQQRASMGWGTPTDLMRPEYQAGKFYEHLRAVDGWEGMRLTDAAQRVQRSGFPEAYQQWEQDAEKVVAAVSGVASVDMLGGGFPGDPCGLANAAYTLPSGAWRAPVAAAIGSGFRTPDRPEHNGVDLTAVRYTPVHAASNGTVITVECNASTGNCDIDGSTAVRGCGWYVEIAHPGNVVTRYCHLVRRPEVTKGQVVPGGFVIGYVGTSGNSEGPHLHFEVHVNAPPTDPSNAVDPVPFMQRAGGPLGVT